VEFARAFNALLKRAHKTLSALAEALHIDAKTLRNFRDRKVQKPRAFTVEDMLAQLDVPEDDTTRRDFLILAGKLGIAYIALPRVPIVHSVAKILPVLKYQDVCLEDIERGIESCQDAFILGGDVHKCLENIEYYDARLRPYPVTERRIAEVRITAGMLLANIQETTASWRDDRPRMALATYNQLKRDVFTERNQELFATQYATLIARRAILYRERGIGDDLDRSAQQFRILESHLGGFQAHRLEAAYRVQKMHLFAVAGDKNAWEQEQASVRQWLHWLKNDADYEALIATFEYILGVGNKRFMWRLRNESGVNAVKRTQYAKEACSYLGDLRKDGKIGALATKILNLYDYISEDRAQLELEASELDALVWVEPKEAATRARALLPLARQKYPSVIHKLADTIELGERFETIKPSRRHFGALKK
jgi:hypothetical protein